MNMFGWLSGVRRSGARRLLPVALVGMVITGLLGATVVSANDGPAECAVSASSLAEARELYADDCSLPRVDCDEIDDLWYCSSRVIGNAAPGGVTADDVGASGIGSGGTVVVTVPTTAAPPPQPSVTEPPVTEPPTTEPPVTEPPTTEAPDPTVAPTTPTTAVAPTTAPAPTTTAPTTTVAPPTTSDGGGGGGGGDQGVRRTYAKNNGPERNPMKGWNSGWSDDRQEATVGFQYIKWSDLEPRNGSFDFAAVEDVINRSGSKDRHVILRLYCDWHGDQQTSRGCPDWIYSEVGVKRIKGDNGRYITDYNDPRYLDEAVQAIKALGDRYDDDPRIYTFEIGVLGYWGEWHTWGSKINGDSYQISQQSETRILNAYREAFDRVHLMARYPNRSILATANDIGFHNDFFKPNNDHSAEFDEAIAAGGMWRAGPIGGEIPPGLSSSDFQALYGTSQGREMIETGHYSTMKPTSVDSQYRSQHLELHKRFGYKYQISEARFADSYANSGRANVSLQVKNIGIAPFYYDWQVQFALIGSDGQPVSVTEAEAHDLRLPMPGDEFALDGNVPLAGVSSGNYRLAVRILQPDADEPKQSRWQLDARNTYILFANDMPVIDGSWNGQNQLVGGWSVLGNVTVG